MSEKDNDNVEWVEATEEVVETEASLPLKQNTAVAVETTETSIQKLLNSVSQEESAGGQNGFCCEECLFLFQNQSDPDNINGPSFILDFPTGMGAPQRALLTLPYGLLVGRSSIPGAGVGVINHGPAVSPGMHFGPLEGEMTRKETAFASPFSWEVFKGDDQYEYIDASNDSYANWMRHVTFARNRDETNLLAVQYNGSILFHCCRTIQTGDELTVWPSDKLFSDSSDAWTQLLLSKINTTESVSADSPLFLCSHCQLSFTTEIFLQRHVEHFHMKTSQAVVGEAPLADADSSPSAASVPLPDESVQINVCGDCGKVFKQLPHLRRHKLCVHSNKRPYCCPHCRRSFNQASGLIRHQLVHRKPRAGRAASLDGVEGPTAAGAEESIEVAEEAESDGLWICSECGHSFRSKGILRKHKAVVHEKLRPFVCVVCQRCFSQHTDLDKHLKSHRSDAADAVCADIMPFSCAKCSTSFASVDLLQQHIDQVHYGGNGEAASLPADPPPSQRPQRLMARSKVSAVTKLVAPRRKASSSDPDAAAVQRWFSCNRCKTMYGDPDELRAHRCSPKRFKCGQCGATFSKAGFLQRHELMAHYKSKSYTCGRCGKDFTSASRLKRHQNNDSCGGSRCASEHFPCSYCQFSFTIKSYLAKHVKRHHPIEFLALCEQGGLTDEADDSEGGRNPKGPGGRRKQVKGLFLCTDCGKSFNNLYNLKLHQRIHTGEKPFTCTQCGKRFSYVGQLNVHMRTHTGEKPFLCTHCGESFRQSGDLKRHERKHTGVRPYSCPECGKSFSRPQSLKAHQLLHLGQRMFKCGQCGKSFSRNYHLRRHHQKMHM